MNQEERKFFGIPESAIIYDYLGSKASEFIVYTIQAHSPRQGMVMQTRMYKMLGTTPAELGTGNSATQYVIVITCSSIGKLIASYKMNRLTNTFGSEISIRSIGWTTLRHAEFSFYDRDGPKKLRTWVDIIEKEFKELYGNIESIKTALPKIVGNDCP